MTRTDKKDVKSFMLQYSPSKQMDICHDKKGCYLGNYPTLAQLRNEYGGKTPMAWLVPQLYDLSEYCGVKDKLSEKMLEELSYVIATEYHYLKISELLLFFHYFKAGRYGRFYGTVDPLVITTALIEFVRERNVILSGYEKEKNIQKSQSGQRVLTRAEYLARKQHD